MKKLIHLAIFLPAILVMGCEKTESDIRDEVTREIMAVKEAKEKEFLDELKKQPGSHTLDDKLIELYRMDAEKNTRKAIDDEVARRVRGLKK
mgnify:CR=1 FL=1